MEKPIDSVCKEKYFIYPSQLYPEIKNTNQLLYISTIIFTFAVSCKLKKMERDKINELLGIALTSKEIQHTFKKYVSNLSVDIPAESLGILLAIHHFDTDVIQQEIAEVVKKDKSSVLRQIDNLEKKKLVQRVVDPNDRRRNIIKITESGVKLIDEINIKLDELFSLLSEGLSISDIETFNNVLSHLRNKARRL